MSVSSSSSDTTVYTTWTAKLDSDSEFEFTFPGEEALSDEDTVVPTQTPTPPTPPPATIKITAASIRKFLEDLSDDSDDEELFRPVFSKKKAPPPQPISNVAKMPTKSPTIAEVQPHTRNGHRVRGHLRIITNTNDGNKKPAAKKKSSMAKKKRPSTLKEEIKTFRMSDCKIPTVAERAKMDPAERASIELAYSLQSDEVFALARGRDWRH